MSMTFFNVTNDVVFRKIFSPTPCSMENHNVGSITSSHYRHSNENKKEILISFLNAVLKFPEDQKIIDIIITTPYLPLHSVPGTSKLLEAKLPNTLASFPNLVGERVTIVDVNAKDQAGNTFLVEMQVIDQDFFAKRILMYTCKSYGNQLEAGQHPRTLKPVYLIAILNFTFSEGENYHSIHRILDVKTQEHILKDIEFHFIELKKFTKDNAEISDLFEKWIYFVKNAHFLKQIPQNIDDKGLQEAYQAANEINWTKKEQEDYEKMAWKEYEIQDGLIKAERLGIEKGKELGLQEGLEEGLEKGEAIGLEKGKLLTKIELAKSLKTKGMDISIIMEVSGLTLEEIKKL